VELVVGGDRLTDGLARRTPIAGDGLMFRASLSKIVACVHSRNAATKRLSLDKTQDATIDCLFSVSQLGVSSRRDSLPAASMPVAPRTPLGHTYRSALQSWPAGVAGPGAAAPKSRVLGPGPELKEQTPSLFWRVTRTFALHEGENPLNSVSVHTAARALAPIPEFPTLVDANGVAAHSWRCEAPFFPGPTPISEYLYPKLE